MQLRLTLALMGLAGSSAVAQPADLPIPAASSTNFPAGIRVARTPSGAVYTDAKGRILYGMDMRVLLRSGPDPSQHCDASCAKIWEPLLASGKQPDIRFPSPQYERASKPASAGAAGADRGAAPLRRIPIAEADFHPLQNAPDWAVIAGPEGPQWVYKGWHMVFVHRRAEGRSTAFDGAENGTWNTLKFVPPAPATVAPSGVRPLALDGAYVLADAGGHILFTGDCRKDCRDWRPFAAGMASASIGNWSVSNAGDRARWMWRGKPVFVTSDDDPGELPASGKVLRP